MESTTGGEGGEVLPTLFDCLANTDRRHLLGALPERTPGSLTRRDLATVLVSKYREDSQDEAWAEEMEQALIDLHHRHLPKLQDAGLIEQDSDRETVTIADHPALQDPGIIDVIRDPEGAVADSLDALFLALTYPRRRTILDVLSHQFGPIHTETLGREIGAKELDTSESDVAEADVDDIIASLHSIHLPKLSEAGLIDHDPEEQTVAYEGHRVLRVPWMHSVLAPDFRASLTGESEPNGIGEIQGREKVISFGQSLCDRADEELFCMFTDTGLLEAGCLTRIRDAPRGGADVYLGTCDETVREYVQENAPEVVLWEPKRNWLNLPVAGNRVGRLLLADREAIRLGTLREETEDGLHLEKAMISEGSDNTLVVMICQLLTPYLEQIDEQTEEIESNLPLSPHPCHRRTIQANLKWSTWLN